MPTTSNFGWTTPADTDLVKDGAAAIRTLGNGIDTSLVDLKGGTTGQVLSKASNTDLDFTWSSVDPLTILDAKGDLISATAADTPARLAVGTDGQYLQADSTTATGLKWATVSAGGWTEIASGNLPTNSNTLTISSIPTTYKFLRFLVSDCATAGTGVFACYPNSDSTADIYTILTAFPTTSSTSNRIDGPDVKASGTDAYFVIDFMNYTEPAMKQFVSYSLGNNTGTTWTARTQIGAYRSTSAITSLQFVDRNVNNFSAGTYKLWGGN